MFKLFKKDPDAVLDYKFDFKALTNGSGPSDYLGTSEIIASYVLTPEDGITVDSDGKTDSDTSVTIWLSGGTVGSHYDIACKITTNSSPARVDERTITVDIVDK